MRIDQRGKTMTHIQRARAGYDAGASKRRVNLTLNEDLVRVAQTYTDNLSGTIEMLLADWTRVESQKHDDDQQHRQKVATAWNAFDERCGRFADEWNRDFTPNDDGG